MNSDVIYTAGLFDGEGYVEAYLINDSTRNKPKKSAALNIQMSDPSVIKWLSSVFGGSITISKKRQKEYKDMWRWQIRGDAAVKMANLFLPYSRVKRPQLLKFIEFVRCNTLEGQKILAAEIKELKKIPV